MMCLPHMNMLDLSSSVRIAHIRVARCWKFFHLNYIKIFWQYRLCKGDHAYLTYFMLQRHLSHLNSRQPSLSTAKLELLIFVHLASPCVILVVRTCSFSCFCMTSAYCLQNFVIESYTYGRLKAVCNSRTRVHLGIVPMVWITLFCRRYNFRS
jgi:hypothetical protein